MPDTSADASGADTTTNTRVVATRRQASASRHGREKRIGLLPASHAPNKGRPRWPGFLTYGSQRRVGLPERPSPAPRCAGSGAPVTFNNASLTAYSGGAV